jgi:hypothetical protein
LRRNQHYAPSSGVKSVQAARQRTLVIFHLCTLALDLVYRTGPTLERENLPLSNSSLPESVSDNLKICFRSAQFMHTKRRSSSEAMHVVKATIQSATVKFSPRFYRGRAVGNVREFHFSSRGPMGFRRIAGAGSHAFGRIPRGDTQIGRVALFGE